ncbi:cytochrome P450 2U1-like [Lytechinus variegatus]|uniref:cytochrome P450 2U1-like n=1 Tax=Lytechinus variegatus TaxID=7654 RepID=UPI001BB14190|nr:cytochrome P450 2U1-like [Lytechinus variegatus]
MSLGCVIGTFAGLGLQSILVGLFGALLVIWCFGSRKQTTSNLPPGPTGLPLLGYLPFLKLPPFKGFTHLTKQYGGLISLRLGTKLCVVLNDVDSVRQSLIKEADVFTDRNVPIEYSLALPLEGSLAFASGDKWRELRTFVAKSFRLFEVEKEKLESVIVRESERLCKAFHDEAIESSSGGDAFDPHHIIKNAVSNIICSLCFGQTYEYSDPEFKHILTVVGNSFRSLSPSGLLLVSRYFYYTPLYREVRHDLAVLQDFIRGIVQRHQETFDPDNTRDIIDMYLAEVRQLKEDGKETYLKEENIWRGVFDIFLAASESMTSALRWILLYLIAYPELQRKIRADILRVIGPSRNPTIKDRDELPLVEATCMEVLRLRPPAPMGGPRQVKRDVKVKGYVIPEGTLVLTNLWHIHQNAENWQDPERFNPSRFLNEDGKELVKNPAFLPYGAGRRLCIGDRIARMQMFLFLTTLIRRFEFSLPDGDVPDFNVDGGNFTLSAVPFKIIAREVESNMAPTAVHTQIED